MRTRLQNRTALAVAALVVALVPGCGTHQDDAAGARAASGSPPMVNNGAAPQSYGSPPPSYAQPQGGEPAGPAGGAVPSSTEPVKIPVPPPSSNWSLLERQQWDRLSYSISNGMLQDLNRRCNARIQGYFEFESWRGHFTNSTDNPLDSITWSRAIVPLSVVHNICAENELGANTVRAKVRAVEIHFITRGNSSFTFQNGVVAAYVNPADGVSDADYQRFMTLELKKRL